MIPSLPTVMGLQSRPSITRVFYHHVEHDSRQRKDIQHDRSDNISHSTYYFKFWKFIAHVSTSSK